MNDLDLCYELRKEIKELDGRIVELELAVRAPKAQPMNDMPHATTRQNIIEGYIIRKEKLFSKKYKLEAELDAAWNRAKAQLTAAGVGHDGIDLTRLRMYHGLSWKRCTEIMKKKYGKWNENKTFRIYREIVTKLKKLG